MKQKNTKIVLAGVMHCANTFLYAVLCLRRSGNLIFAAVIRRVQILYHLADAAVDYRYMKRSDKCVRPFE